MTIAFAAIPLSIRLAQVNAVVPVATLHTDWLLLFSSVKSLVLPSPTRLSPPAAVRKISPSAVAPKVGSAAVPAKPRFPAACAGKAVALTMGAVENVLVADIVCAALVKRQVAETAHAPALPRTQLPLAGINRLPLSVVLDAHKGIAPFVIVPDAETLPPPVPTT